MWNTFTVNLKVSFTHLEDRRINCMKVLVHDFPLVLLNRQFVSHLQYLIHFDFYISYDDRFN